MGCSSGIKPYLAPFPSHRVPWTLPPVGDGMWHNENFYDVALITKQTGNKKSMRYFFREPFRTGKFSRDIFDAWLFTVGGRGWGSHGASSGILVIPKRALPPPLALQADCGDSDDSACVCVCVCAAVTPSVCVFVYKNGSRPGGRWGTCACCSVRWKHLTSCSPLKITMSLLLFILPFLLFLGLVF